MSNLQTVAFGAASDGSQGDNTRAAFTKVNANSTILATQDTLTSFATTLTSAQALTFSSHVGKRVNVNLATSGTINVPAAGTCTADNVLLIRNLGTTLVTLAVTAASGDTLAISSLYSGETVLLDTDGVHTWNVLTRGRSNSINEVVSGSLTTSTFINTGGSYSGPTLDFSPSVANSAGYITARPSGSGTVGGFQAFAAADRNNSAFVTMYMTGANAIINTSKTGSGTATPLDIYTNSNINWRFYASSTGQTNAASQFSVPVVAGALHLGGAPQYGLVMQSTGTASNKYWLIGPNTNNNYCVFDQGAIGVYLVDGSTAWGSQSDERLKNIRSDITGAVEAIKDIRTVRYSWKSDDDHAEALGVANDSRLYVGVIAQDVQRHVPEAVSVSHEDYLGVSYTDLVPLCMAAIKELSAQVADLQARIK